MQANNLRMTHQREIILEELRRSHTHPTADELYEKIRKRVPRMSLATVYRNLEILSAAGLIQKLEISGRQKRFDWNPGPHDHVLCTACHRLDNIDITGPVPELPRELDQRYRITGRRIEFFGLCPHCQTQASTSGAEGESKMSCPQCSSPSLTEPQRQVLEALAKSPEAWGSKEIAESTGLDAKQVSCQITALKKKGWVDSPIRCKYALTQAGQEILK